MIQAPAPSAVSLPLGSHSAKAERSSLPSPPKPYGPLSPFSSPPNHVALSLLPQNPVVLSLVWLPCLGFKSQHQSSSTAPFPTPPTIIYTCQHSLSFQLYWAATVSLGRYGPMAWNQSSPSSHAGRRCNQGELLPSYILGGSHLHLPGSKQGHSYLTYL